MSLNKITTCLWFDGQASDAASFYTSIFPNSSITDTQRYTTAGTEVHGREPGSVMTVSFALNGHPFVGLNGGPHFKFNEAISFQVMCEDQKEVDYYWGKLGDIGEGKDGWKECGWLKDRFGVAWQVVPKQLLEYLKEGSAEQKVRTMNAMMKMVKMDIEGLRKAFEGQE